MKIEEIENGIKITVPKKENHTLDDLKQRLINYLMELEFYEDIDIEIIKILFK